MYDCAGWPHYELSSEGQEVLSLFLFWLTSEYMHHHCGHFFFGSIFELSLLITFTPSKICCTIGCAYQLCFQQIGQFRSDENRVYNRMRVRALFSTNRTVLAIPHILLSKALLAFAPTLLEICSMSFRSPLVLTISICFVFRCSAHVKCHSPSTFDQRLFKTLLCNKA